MLADVTSSVRGSWALLGRLGALARRSMKGGRIKRAVSAAAAALTLATCLGVQAAGRPTDRGADVLVAARDLRASLDRLLVLLEEDERRAERDACATSDLYSSDAATRQEVERAASILADARAKAGETRRQIEEVEAVISEAAAVERAEEPATRVARARVSGGFVRSAGAPGWTLARIARVRAFYAVRFGHDLPVSALGQTAVHNRLGFDHRNSFDVAVRPDSPEGRALMSYLRAENIPFIAFNGPVPGKATGAHIHVGYPSPRR